MDPIRITFAGSETEPLGIGSGSDLVPSESIESGEITSLSERGLSDTGLPVDSGGG